MREPDRMRLAELQTSHEGPWGTASLNRVWTRVGTPDKSTCHLLLSHHKGHSVRGDSCGCLGIQRPGMGHRESYSADDDDSAMLEHGRKVWGALAANLGYIFGEMCIVIVYAFTCLRPGKCTCMCIPSPPPLFFGDWRKASSR